MEHPVLNKILTIPKYLGNGKWGLIDKAGKIIIDLKYDRSIYFHEVLAGVGIKGKYGYIDKTGRFIIAPKYDSVSPFHEGMAVIILNGKWGMKY